MNPQDAIALVATVAVIGFFAALGSRHSENVKRAQAERNRELAASKLAEEASIQDEVDFVASCAATPAAETALSRLKERYGWAEIVETISLHRLHLRLLRETEDGTKIQLPNLKLVRYGKGERKLIREAQTISPTALQWPEDIRPLIQEPTVETLLDLHNAGFLRAEPDDAEPTRNYSVYITILGRRFKHLDAKFRDKHDGLGDPESRYPHQTVRQNISKILRSALSQMPT